MSKQPDWAALHNLEGLEQKLHPQDVDAWYAKLSQQLSQYLSGEQDKRSTDYLQTIDRLQAHQVQSAKLDQSVVMLASSQTLAPSAQADMKANLQALCPWRKGPFSIFGVQVDAEWQSDLKWDRISPLLGDITGKRVLDVGCGNGYYSLRLIGAGAGLVLGVDPTVLNVAQFMLLKSWLQVPIWIAPARIEAMPDKGHFDLVLSMGVLSHRRDPLAHLEELKSRLLPGGTLIIETLIIEGQAQAALIPKDRYARMRNIWQLPSQALLEHWLNKSGYRDVQFIRADRTTTQEQRTTAWMPFESLEQSLAKNKSLTVEGYPAPLRGIFKAYR